MTRETTPMTPELENAVLLTGIRDRPAFRRCRELTAKLPGAVMQIGAIQAQFLGFLVEMQQARLILELGTFTGYSAMAMAAAMPPGGVLHTCDIDPASMKRAEQAWEEAGLAHRIKSHLTPGLIYLEACLAEPSPPQFDLIFIDADKANYRQYYEKGLMLLKRGGLIIVDNVFWSGRIADLRDQGKAVTAIRAFNEFVLQDERVSLSMIPVGDGLSLLRKR